MLSSCVRMCVEATALFFETICHSLGPGCESQGTPPLQLPPPQSRLQMCVPSHPAFSWVLWMSFSFSCFCSKHYPVPKQSPWLCFWGYTALSKGHNLSVPSFLSEMEVLWFVWWAVVGLMGWNIDASPVPSLKPGLHECIGFNNSQWKQGYLRS